MSDLWPRTLVDAETYCEAYGDLPGWLDKSTDWQSHNPESEWTREDEAKWRAEQDRWHLAGLMAMAYWWDLEGVRCATFGRNPNLNPYREMLKGPLSLDF